MSEQRPRDRDVTPPLRDETVPSEAPASDGTVDKSAATSAETGAAKEAPPEEQAGTQTTVWKPSSGEEAPAAPASAPQTDTERFEWHPEYAGRTVEDVRRELEQEIAADQRQYSIAMAGAEEAEQDALASVVALERKWGRYDFGWAELDAGDLASRIVAFEQEREQRREMCSWEEYRQSRGDAGMADGDQRPAELSTGMKAISLGLVVLLIVLILLAVWAL